MLGLGKMRRDITDPMCQRECSECPLNGITPKDCPGDCLDCRYSGFCPCGNRFIYAQFTQFAQGNTTVASDEDVAIEAIRQETPRAPAAAYDKAMVRILSQVLKLLGQPRPLLVTPQKGGQRGYRLVGGFDILLAAKALGWKTVSSTVVELDRYEETATFYRCELLRLDLSWENQARCLLALQELYRERHHLLPSVSALSTLSGLSVSRTRDLLHGITLLKKHKLSDGTIPFPTLLRSVRFTYPDSIQRELIRGLATEGWTRRRATSHATSKIRKRTDKTVDEVIRRDNSSSRRSDVFLVAVNRPSQSPKKVALVAMAGTGGK